jgi:NAD+ diphosphatase
VDLLQDLALARFTVDRAAATRINPNWIEDAWNDSRTRLLLVNESKIPVTDDLSPIFIAPSAFPVALEDLREATVLLGVDDDHTYIALWGYKDHLGEAAWVSLRDFGATMSARDVGLAITATALATWHATHSFCPLCGGTTQLIQAGWARHCAVDDKTHFPRTEPAMIVAVEDDQERILLGRRTGWEPSWFSALAGFVEAGESCEAAVVREVLEESGIRVDPESLRYLGSQPWPFPASLMMGYRAKALTTEVELHDDEMHEVKWFSRAEFEQACNTGDLKVPNPTSIAWRLIENWYGQELQPSWSRA